MSAELFHLTFTRFFWSQCNVVIFGLFHGCQVMKQKDYIFEFTSAEEADVFCEDKIFFAVFVG